MEDTAVSTDGIPLRFEARGSGALALVFVHVWSCDRSYWKPELDYFADEFQVVAIDLAGHGESGMGRDDWTMPAFGDDVVAVADHLVVVPTEVVYIGRASLHGLG
ncbi:MAG: alpha/beta hydrolase, partial [Actinomycetota bacterium]